MGVTSSTETGSAERRVHWILSEPANVEQAFNEVWERCEHSGASSLVTKSSVLAEILDVIGNEGCALIDVQGADELDPAKRQQTRAAQQLRRAVEILPESMTRKEAFNLFRNILLTVQSAMMIKHGHIEAVTLADSPSAMRLGSKTREAKLDTREEAQAPGVDGFPAEQWPSHIKPSCRVEDDAPRARVNVTARRLHPALKDAEDLLNGGGLPPRSDLEVQIQTLRRLGEELRHATTTEMAVVKELESEASAKKASSRADPLRRDEEARAAKLRGHEELLEQQRRSIEALIAQRHQEEMEVDELYREARELSSELRSCRRSCGSLESEIASEEVRAAALRDAFEGRRARFATAETAMRNAEQSNMRLTRRRIAAEITARREEEAVQEARQFHSEQEARQEQQCEVITAEIAELRAQVLLKGPNLEEELRVAEMQLTTEVAEAEEMTRDLMEVEATIQTLENQTANRESEMFALQRRRLRESIAADGSRSPRHRTEEEDSNAAAERVALQALEQRVAEGHRREQALREQLQQLRASQHVTASRHGEELRLRAESAWSTCRALATELGEAEAALWRRQAEQQHSGKEVVDALKEKLKAAMEQEDKNVAELAQVRSQTAKHLSEEKVDAPSDSPPQAAGWLPNLIPSWLMGSAGDAPVAA